MDPLHLTRTLVDIPSVTGDEKAVALFLRDYLARLGAEVELQEAEPDRPNVFACWGNPQVVLSTHTDTVPPFISSHEDDEFIYGRGACDAKGIIAAQVAAAERLRAEGSSNFGLLFLVGEERNSAGAVAANRSPRGSRYLINGEPTENLLAVGTKGVLRIEIVAHGRMAHSAYPALGESATEKLIAALNRLREVPLPNDDLLGETTYNLGILQGGVAPNVIPDHARAEVMFRIVECGDKLLRAITDAVGSLATVTKILEMPPMRLGTLEGIETTVVAFSTDVPALAAWGKPFLIGPGSIHVAHTEGERIPKAELMQAVEIYVNMVRKLQQQGG
jgi:acetylornithine deacetylase